MEIDQVSRVGTTAVYAAGKVLKKYFEGPNQIRKKGMVDLVTEADLAAEGEIIAAIRRVFPDHSILAEESGAIGGQKTFQWIIDPLDGTTNFAHRLPFYAVSIAFTEKGKTVMGMVFNPANGELFSAIRGRGAFLNKEPIHVSNTKTLIDSLLVTGFPYDTGEIVDIMMERLTAILKASQSILRLGSAALDLCYVACGRCDGFWQQNLSPWDTAGGALIVSEAGGKVTDFEGAMHQPDKKQILATNAGIHNKMLHLLTTRRTDGI